MAIEKYDNEINPKEFTYISNNFDMQNQAASAIKGDWVLALVELCTNVDDSVSRFNESANSSNKKKNSALITIDSSQRTLTISDRAEGMSKEDLDNKIVHKGEQTSGILDGLNVRGGLGRGAKDISNLGAVTWESVKDGMYSTLHIKEDFMINPDDFFERPVKTSDLENMNLKSGQNGTKTTIKISKPPFRTFQKLYEQLSKDYALRDIFSDPSADYKLQDKKAKPKKISYTPPKQQKRYEEEGTIPGYSEATYTLEINKLDEPDTELRDRTAPSGILIVGRKTIYEKKHFKNAIHSNKISGRLTIPYLDELIKEVGEDQKNGISSNTKNPSLIINTDRTLNKEHPFYQALEKEISPQYQVV